MLAELTPHVYSVEIVAALARSARNGCSELGYPGRSQGRRRPAGWPEHAPYDGIIVTAAAPDVPPALVAQLADAGRLVIPVGETAWNQTLWLIQKDRGPAARGNSCAKCVSYR